MLSARASQFPIACWTTRLESPYMMRRVAPHVLSMRMPWRSASYSASLLEAWLKLIWRTYFSFVPLGEMNTTPAPAPCCLLDPSKNIDHELDWSGGAWCLNLRPLDQKIWKYLGFDGCWVLELQVPWAELNVPLGDSSSCYRVVEYVSEWRAAHDCDRVLVEVVGHLS